MSVIIDPGPEPKREVVFLPGKARRRFYEPVIVLKALMRPADESAQRKASTPTSRPRSQKGRFQKFVYRLASVCDRKRGGTTVTSFSVLRSRGGVVYAFGSNQIGHNDLSETREYVVRLLEYISQAYTLSSTATSSLKRDILRHILLFNRPRVEHYMGELQINLKRCIRACQSNEHESDIVVHDKLAALNIATASEDSLRHYGSERYVKQCVRCIRAIEAFSSSGAYRILRDRARQGGMPGQKSVECWSELCHYISRLYAYRQAVGDFLDAQDELPQLFRSPQVIAIPSSKVVPKPLGNKSQVASNIIGRMKSQKEDIHMFQEMAEALQMFSLDERIRYECEQASFKPIVHSEVLVLDWILNNTERPQYRFFNGWRFIGSSKDTCRLCHHYFAAHPSKVEVRPSHGNLYLNWRFPDVYEDQGADAMRQRQDILNKVTDSIRHDASDIMDQKQPMCKKHDSNTYSGLSIRRTLPGSSVAQDDGPDISELREALRSGKTLSLSPDTEDDLIVYASDDGEDSGASGW